MLRYLEKYEIFLWLKYFWSYKQIFSLPSFLNTLYFDESCLCVLRCLQILHHNLYTAWSIRKVSKIFAYNSKNIWATKIYHIFLDPWILDIFAGVSCLHVFQDFDVFLTNYILMIIMPKSNIWTSEPASKIVQKYTEHGK